ncbi:MAG: hypothetical protein P4N60_22115 [Verrucomicrobiae bacterium]|nr:hypothetical protein [Verrucomicrobiae bacterium]
MADDASLKVGIEIAVNGTDEIKALNKEMGVVVVTQEDVNKALGASADKTKESDKATEHHTESAREMHHAFHALNEIVPGLGSALRIAFHPGSIGIVGLLAAFEGLKTVLESIHEIDAIKPADFVGDTAAIDAARESYDKARVAAQLFVDEQIRLNRAGATAAEVSARQIANYKNLAAAQSEYNTAQKGLGDAEIEALENKGVISHGEALKRKFALDVQYAKEKLRLEADTAAQEMAAKQKQLETEQGQLKKAQAERTTDEANAETTAQAKAKHDAAKSTAEKNIEGAQKTLDELAKPKGTLVKGEISEENIGKLENFFNDIIPAGQRKGDETHSEMFLKLQEYLQKNSILHGGISSPEMKDARVFMAHDLGNQSVAAIATYDGAKQQLDAAKKQLDELAKSQFKVDLAAERGQKQLDATDDAVRKLSESVAKLAAEIPQTKADNAAKLTNDAATQNLDLRAQAIKAGLPDPGNTFIATKKPVISQASEPAGNQTPWQYGYNQPPAPAPRSANEQARGDFNFAEHSLDILNSGGKLAANQEEHLRHIVEVMSGHKVSSDQVLQTLRGIMRTSNAREAAFQEELRDLKSMMAQTPNNSR